MRAVRLERFGAPDALTLLDVPDPRPHEGWATVELRAAGLNWHDVLVRRGVYPSPLPLTPGGDGAGVRRDTGEPVIILPSLRWGDDERFPAPGFEILGDVTDGTYAELVAVPEENLFAKPADWAWPEAAALGLAGVTAYRALFSRGGLRAGETVLVLGAASGVSTIAVSLAVIAGARVLVTSSEQSKIDRGVALGAEGGVLYTDAAWPQALREMAGERGVDLVIDSAGTWAESLSVLNRGASSPSGSAPASAPRCRYARSTSVSRPSWARRWAALGTSRDC